MKIPTGGSGNGYYGHESGVISYLDNVENDGPEGPAQGEDDFSEYMWMENEEEFDKQVNISNQLYIGIRLYFEDKLCGNLNVQIYHLNIGTPTVRRRRIDGRVLGSNVGRGEAA